MAPHQLLLRVVTTAMTDPAEHGSPENKMDAKEIVPIVISILGVIAAFLAVYFAFLMNKREAAKERRCTPRWLRKK